MARIKLFVILITGSFLSLTKAECPETWTPIPPMPSRGQESQGRPDFQTDPRYCIKLFAEVAPTPGQPVSANFEVSWNVAKRICVSEGIKAANIPRNGFNGTTARLAEVNSQHKNDQLKGNAELVLGQSILGKYIWIGGNDLARRNVWAWGSTGYRIYPYVNWLEGFPSISEGETSEAQCTLLDPAHGFQWISDSCGNINDNKHYFFCELYNDEKIKHIPQTTPAMTTPKTTSQAPEWTNHVSFHGNGYLDIDKKLLDYQEGRQLEIKMELSTVEKEGLLLWQGKNDNEVKNYIALGITEGKAKLWVNDQSIMAIKNGSPIVVSDGETHTIIVTIGKVENNILDRNTVILTVDKHHAPMKLFSWDMDALKTMDPFFGGLPSYERTGNKFSLGFAGCIESLEVNNHYIGHPGGEGAEHKNMKSFHGSFRDILESLNKGWEGMETIEDGKVCEPKVRMPPPRPVYTTATTVTTTNAPFVPITKPTEAPTPPFVHVDVTFDGNAYYHLKSGVYPLESLNSGGNNLFDGNDAKTNVIALRLKLTTLSSNGLLVWYENRENWDVKNFIAIVLIDGKLEACWNFNRLVTEDTCTILEDDIEYEGTGEGIIHTGGRINDGELHEIVFEISRVWSKIIFKVDGNGDEFEINAQIPTYPNANLHVGGLPEGTIRRDALERLKNNEVVIEDNFYGCLHEMSIEVIDDWNNRQVKPISFSDRDDVRAAVPSKVRYCNALTPPPPLTSKRPTIPPPPATTTRYVPPPRPPIITEKPRPIFTTPKAPEPCIYDTIKFGGRGYIQLGDRFIGNVEPSYRLTIRMSFSPAAAYNSDALLLWQGSKSRNNFVAIGIRDQNVEFSMLSDFSISVPLKYEQGISYNITIIKYGAIGQNVDVELHVVSWRENDVTLGDTREMKQYTQQKTFKKRRSEGLYLGGAQENQGVSSLTGGLYSKAFKGIINHLEIRKKTPKSFGGVIDIKTTKNNKNVLSWSGVSCVDTRST